MIIPLDIMQAIDESKKRKNILLLAMSTLFTKNGEVEKNKYSYDGIIDGQNYKAKGEYIGSMEPVPMILIDYFKDCKPKEALDEIIILGTEKTSELINFILPDENINCEKSAEQLFIENIKLHCEKKDIAGPNIKIYTYTENKENSIKENIKNIVDYIRSKKDNDQDGYDEEIVLWMDDHGGFRAVQSIMQSVINILEIEEIIPKEVFTGQYNNVEKTFEVISSRRSYDMYEFASGMHAFFNYGRSKQLEKFFSNAEGNDKKLINYIKNISDYMSLCDVKKLEVEFKKLGRFLKEKGILEFDTYLQIFIPNIEKDYGDLLSGEKHIIKRILWCLEKGYIQQAMAFIESWIPELLVQKSLLGYGPNDFGETFNIFDKNTRQLTGKQITLGIALEKVKGFKNKYNYLVDKIILNWQENEKTFNYVDIEWRENRREYYIRIEDIITDDKRNDISKLLSKHRLLKEERNKIMHASEKPHMSYEDLEVLIKNYMELIDSLIYNKY